MKKQFLMIIETDDENIEEKYTNWGLNYSTPEQFIRFLADSKKEETYIDSAGIKRSIWKEFGYRVKVKKI